LEWDRREQATMMNMVMMAMPGRSLSAEDSPSKKSKRSREKGQW